MINFRYHLVSLVAVFLALAIGVIMGTAVIDNAVVDRLETQQRQLDRQVEVVRSDNAALAGRRDDLESVAERLTAEELVRLVGVPVLAIGTQGGELDAVDDLLEVLDGVGARLLGTVWLTERWSLGSSDDAAALRAATGATASSTNELRAEALGLLTDALRRLGPAGIDPRAMLADLEEAGFVELDTPPDADGMPVIPESTRFVVVSGPEPDVPDAQVLFPLIRALRLPEPGRVTPPVLAAVALPRPADGEDGDDEEAGPPGIVAMLREDPLGEEVATVDHLDDIVGRVAAAIALADLADGQTGHYGRGPGADDLLPATAGS